MLPPSTARLTTTAVAEEMVIGLIVSSNVNLLAQVDDLQALTAEVNTVELYSNFKQENISRRPTNHDLESVVRSSLD